MNGWVHSFYFGFCFRAGVVSTLAGGQYGYLDGTGTAAKFRYVRSLVVNGNGAIFVVDPNNCRVRMVTTSGIQLFYQFL